MIQKKKKSILYTWLDAINLYSYAMSKFLPTKGFQSIHPQEFDLNMSAIVQMDVFWKLILNIQKELR